MNRLRAMLDAGKTTVGTHISLNNPVITELVGSCGFDYVWIDTEHTTVTLEELQMHFIAARAAGAASVARIPWNDPVRLKPVLEMGPDGVVIPQVNSYEEAKEAVKAFLYPPRGTRGYGPQRASRFGLMPIDEYLAHYDETVRILQVEHIDAVRDIDRIVTIPEIDVLLIGPCDLASSMGKIGKWEDEEVQETIDRVCEKIKASGKKLGLSYGPLSDEMMARWKERKVDMISIGADTNFIAQGASDTFAQLKRFF